MAVAAHRFGNIWVANAGTSNVTKLDSSGRELPDSPFPAGTTPSAIVCDRQGKAYVANRDSKDKTIFSAVGIPLGNLPAGLNPVEIALDFQENIWVANDLQSTMTRLPPGGGPPISFTVGVGPRGIGVAGDGTLWIFLFTGGLGSTTVRLRPDGFIQLGCQASSCP